ncbi:hypothetical protein [Streptomyces sp. NPDC001083]|uniref:hypothetical protein n=1 Tax=Streptomyces sp. NPDC001083 TaxID=3364545 RepID=UPI00368024A0
MIELLKRVSQETRLLLRSALSQSCGTSQGLYEVEISRGGERGQHQAVRHHVCGFQSQFFTVQLCTDELGQRDTHVVEGPPVDDDAT